MIMSVLATIKFFSTAHVFSRSHTHTHTVAVVYGGRQTGTLFTHKL